MLAPSKQKQESIINEMINWWFGTVAFAFFPLLLTILMSCWRYGAVDFHDVLGNGELILAAFTIAIPTLIKCAKKRQTIFFLLLFGSFLEIVAYAIFKTNEENLLGVVYVTSVICILSSVIICYIGERHTGRRGIYEAT